MRENVKIESSNRELHEAMAIAGYHNISTGVERGVMIGGIVFSLVFWGTVYQLIFG